MEIICFNFVSVVVGLCIAVIMMLSTKPLFAVILLTWFCLHMGATFLFLRVGNERFEIHSEAVSTLSGKLVDSLTNILNVRLFARSSYETQYLSDYQKDEITKAKRAMSLMEIMRICQGLFGLSLIFSMIFTLIHGWIHGWVTLGDFSLIGMLSFWVLGMVWYMSYQMTVFVREVGTVNEALTLITKEHDIKDIARAAPLQVNHGEIRFNDVSFYYQKNTPIFQHLQVDNPSRTKNWFGGIFWLG